MQATPSETQKNSTQTIDRRYDILYAIGEGGMGAVYAVQDRLTGDEVALKQVLSQSEMTGSKTGALELREALAQEFATLASLRHPNIISVLDYGFDDNFPYFTMELLQNPMTIREAARSASPKKKVEYLVQMLQALAYLHRRRIIHRDLKPANALVQNGHLKVLDFGLATLKTGRSEEDVKNQVAGTLAYIAPETLRGAPATVQSDLYAVGVIAYELFAGRHPFDTSNVTQLIQDIVLTSPDVDNLDADVAIQWVIQRLLEKDPADRYSDAQLVINKLSDAIGLFVGEDDQSIRESYLQGAQFVGRDAEMQQLQQAFDQAKDGQGTAWLVGGESGVGKSRLIEEFRIRALVQGATVLRGNAVRDGGRTYQTWFEILRRLVLVVEPDNTTASILKIVVPDIEMLLGRPIPDAPELEPQATRDRLVATIASLFAKVETPMLVLLEDLQWANESLDLINYLSRQLSGWPVLFVGTYRSDERPKLPERLAHLRHLMLDPLQADDIAQLSVAMLGNNGRDPQVVSLLQDETEGNIYFIIEVVRALVEEAGQMAKVGQVTIPDEMFIGGLDSIVQRRLKQLAEDDQPLLALGAIIGREVDVPALQAAFPDVDVAAWLLRAADALILQVRENRWWFAHDKLREGTLAALPEDQRRALHAQAAQAIETVYADDPEKVASLAFHWREAQAPVRELPYAHRAGEQFLDKGLPEEAIAYLQRALELTEDYPIPDNEMGQIKLLLGKAEQEVGRGVQALDHLTQALALFGQTIPRGNLWQVMGIIRQAMIQFWHRRFSKRYWNILDEPAERQRNLQIAQSWQLVSLISFINQKPLLSLFGSLRALNAGELSGPSRVMANSYVSISVLAGTVLKNRGLSDAYYERARDVADTLGEPIAKAIVGFSRGFYLLGRGQWDEAETFLREATALYDDVGDRRWYTQTIIHYAYTHYYRGRLALPRTVYDDVLGLSEERQDPQAIQWATTGALKLAIHAQDHHAAAQHAPRIMQQLDDVAAFDEPSVILSYGLLARHYLHIDEIDLAEQYAQLGHDTIKDAAPPSLYYVLDGYYGVSEVWLVLWERTGDPAYASLVQESLKFLQTFAQTFPIGEPRLLLHQGWAAYIGGDHDKAQAFWHQAAESAAGFAMPVERGLAHYHLGRTLDADHPERDDHLAEADAHFADSEAAAYQKWLAAHQSAS